MCGVNISPSVLAELDKLDAALVPESRLRCVELRVDSRALRQPWPLPTWPEVRTKYLLCREDRMFPAEWARRHAPRAARDRARRNWRRPLCHAEPSARAGRSARGLRGRRSVRRSVRHASRIGLASQIRAPQVAGAIAKIQQARNSFPHRRAQLTADACYCSGSASGSFCSLARRALSRIRLPTTRVKTTLMTRPAITTPPAMSPIIARPSGLFRTTPLR